MPYWGWFPKAGVDVNHLEKVEVFDSDVGRTWWGKKAKDQIWQLHMKYHKTKIPTLATPTETGFEQPTSTPMSTSHTLTPPNPWMGHHQGPRECQHDSGKQVEQH